MLRHRAVVSLAFPALCAIAANAQLPSGPAPRVPAYRTRVLGVFDEATGEPVDGVRVLDVLNGNSSLTTPTGTVSLFFLPDGGSLVRLQKIGYEPQTLTIAISPADTAPVTLTLRRVTQLSPVITKAGSSPRYISPALRGFEERRKSGFGYFVGDSVLRANEGRLLANVITSRMPGIITRAGSASSTYLMQSPRCVGGGPPQVYLDGVPLSPDLPSTRSSRSSSLDNLPFNLTNFDVSSLAGVEWYPDGASLPAEFNHTSARCGALLLWTRER
jgi:hypothetical protein